MKEERRREILAKRRSDRARRRTSVRIASQEGFYYGLGIGLIANSPVVIAGGALPIIAGARTVGKGWIGLVVGDRLISIGAAISISGIAELAGGIVLVRSSGKHRPAGAVELAAFKAAELKGIGLIFALHGLAYAAVASPLIALRDKDLQDLFGGVTAMRVLGYSGIALGASAAIAGTVMALTGWSRGKKLMEQVALGPQLLPGGGMLAIRGRF